MKQKSRALNWKNSFRVPSVRVSTTSKMLSLALLFSAGGFTPLFADSDPVISISQQAEIEVKGLITDGTKPVQGVSVSVKGVGGKSTLTNAEGKFSIRVPEGTALVITSIGYVPQEVVAKANLAIVIQESAETIDELVVVGFGTQKKSNITGAVATVDMKALESRPVSNVTQMLQGQVAGLNIDVGQNGGQLGQNMAVNLRGTGTISASSSASTLILIDGVEGNMNDVNPDDVESISVLKDASASAVYGSRAAFGVILITTKKGKAGKSKITYSNNIRNSGPTNLPKMLNSLDFATYYNEAHTNQGSLPMFSADALDRIEKYLNGEIDYATIPTPGGTNWEYHTNANANVDWYKVHYKRAWTQDHNVNFNGGTEKYQYYVSGNYLNQNGNLRYGEDNFKRYNTMAKVTAKLNDYIDLNTNMRFTRNNLDNPTYIGSGGLFYHDLSRAWPTMPFEDPNGHFMRSGKLAQLTNGSRSLTNTDTFNAQAQTVFRPLQGWNIYAEGTIRTINSNNQSNMNKVYEYDINNQPVEIAFNGDYAAGATYASQLYTNSNMYTTSLYSDYSKRWGDHNFKAMAGMNSEYMKYRAFGGSRSGLFSESVPEMTAAGGLDKLSGLNLYDWATVGFFGRVNYDYKNRYFLELNMRYDGSSRFLGSDRWSVFPSFSAGWNIAEESFLKDHSSIVSMLKPRFSWGKLGNQNTSSIYPFYLTQTINPNAGAWLVDGKRPNVTGVPGLISETLTWEEVESMNFGFDAVGLNNKLTVNFDYYVRKTLGMVGPAAEVGAVFGTSLPDVNNSDLESRGWDVNASWNDRIGEVGYRVGFNLSDSRVKVKQYPNESGSLTTYREGQVLGEIWGYETEGIAKSQAEMDAWLVNNKPTWGSNWGEGDIMYRDLDGDGEVSTGAQTFNNPGDRRIIGNSTPRFRFGLNLGADYKGFDFNVFLQGVAKRDLALDGNSFWGVGGGLWQSAAYEGHLDYYRPENTTSILGANTEAYYARPYIGDDKNQYTQTKYLRSGAYLRVKNIQLGYTLPKHWVNAAKIERVRVYFSGENLFTFSKIPSMFDPEAVGGGWGAGKTYPLQSTISFGTNITF